MNIVHLVMTIISIKKQLVLTISLIGVLSLVMIFGIPNSYQISDESNTAFSDEKDNSPTIMNDKISIQQFAPPFEPIRPTITNTCEDTDPLSISLGLNGSDITVLDANVCKTSGVVECHNGSPLANIEDNHAGEDVRTFVTSTSLCNFQEMPQILECADSGFLVINATNCPIKCPDGTYLMQGMECPETWKNPNFPG